MGLIDGGCLNPDGTIGSTASPAGKPDEVTAELWAMCPEGLIDSNNPPLGVWLSRIGSHDVMGAVPLNVRGPKAAVLAYIRDNWGDDEADQWEQEWTRFPRAVFSFADVAARSIEAATGWQVTTARTPEPCGGMDK